jgi:hypothetical protein
MSHLPSCSVSLDKRLDHPAPNIHVTNESDVQLAIYFLKQMEGQSHGDFVSRMYNIDRIRGMLPKLCLEMIQRNHRSPSNRDQTLCLIVQEMEKLRLFTTTLSPAILDYVWRERRPPSSLRWTIQSWPHNTIRSDWPLNLSQVESRKELYQWLWWVKQQMRK